MKTKAGMWIDHRKAIIVVVADEKEVVIEIRSNVEKQLRLSGGPRFKTEYGAQEAPPDDMQETEFTGHLNIYFDKVISCIRDADSIMIFGPGEAKSELQRRLQRIRLSDRIVAVEKADRMTDRQVAAKVRRGFQLPGRIPRGKPRSRPLSLSHRGMNPAGN